MTSVSLISSEHTSTCRCQDFDTLERRKMSYTNNNPGLKIVTYMVSEWRDAIPYRTNLQRELMSQYENIPFKSWVGKSSSMSDDPILIDEE